MTAVLRSLARHLSRFRRSEDGYVVVEAVLIVPFLLWGYLALYTYWDTYRAMTLSQKASYTIADMISREQAPVNAAYITGMRSTMNYMMGNGLTASLRVSSVVYTAADDRMAIEWSRSTNNASYPPLNNGTLQALVDRIPDMSDGDTIVLVESWTPYDPSLEVGIPDQLFAEFIVTRPRFAPRIIYQ
jgi:Flp pilus assembly protein TadG